MIFFTMKNVKKAKIHHLCSNLGNIRELMLRYDEDITKNMITYKKNCVNFAF